MRTIVILIFIGVFCGLLRASDFQEMSGKHHNKRLTDKLQTIENTYISKLDFSERRQAMKLMDEILEIINKQGNYYDSISSSSLVMTPEYFDKLIGKAKKTPFDDNKMVVLMSGSLGRMVTVEQVIEMCNLFTWDEQKIELIKAYYPIIKNKERFYKLFDVITFESEKNEIKEFIENYGR